jgi:Taurine catabolism dioxygenase TauD, TfdA family
MHSFHGTPVFRSSDGAAANPHLLVLEGEASDLASIREGLAGNRLVLLRRMPFDRAGALFGELAEAYGLRDSYDVQMQYVVELMAARDAVDNIAVTVNKRGPWEIVQPHAEGDTTAPLELFGLHCVRNAASGGENVLSLINQSADHSRLRAKEKAIVDWGMSPQERNKLRSSHLDAKDVISDAPPGCRVLAESTNGAVVVRPVPLTPDRSVVSGDTLVTYWDNVTVHDHAFHKLNYELLRDLGILHARDGGSDYQSYMHVEDDTPWSPVDHDSGAVAETSRLFDCHIVHKMEPGDFLLFNNRAWTHAVNNWPPDQPRTLTAMYA